MISKFAMVIVHAVILPYANLNIITIPRFTHIFVKLLSFIFPPIFVQSSLNFHKTVLLSTYKLGEICIPK